MPNNGLLTLLDTLTFNPQKFPTVADVRAGKVVGPTVIIHAWRNSRWCSTVPVVAADVDWSRLSADDHVETVNDVP